MDAYLTVDAFGPLNDPTLDQLEEPGGGTGYTYCVVV